MKTKVIIAIIALLLLAGCSNNTIEAQPAQQPIKIGVALPVTGSMAAGGSSVQKGILVAQKEINAQGGINGMPVELIMEDTHSVSTDAVTAVTKLIEVDKVPVLIAGAYSAEGVAVAPLAQNSKVVLLSPLAPNTAMDTAGDWVFKLRESTRQHAKAILDEISKRGHKKLGILAASYESCNDAQPIIDKYAKELGISIVLLEHFDTKDTDMRTQISKLKNSDFDAWYTCGTYQDLGLVHKQAKELGISKPAFSTYAIENKKTVEVAGEALEGIIYTTTKWSCDNAQFFCTTLKQDYNVTPDYRSAFGYDSLKLVAEAIRRNGYTSEGIQKGLLSIQDF